jgi:hypothetical protein
VFKVFGEPVPGESSLQGRSILTAAHDDMIIFAPEGDLVTRLEAELISDIPSSRRLDRRGWL